MVGAISRTRAIVIALVCNLLQVGADVACDDRDKCISTHAEVATGLLQVNRDMERSAPAQGAAPKMPKMPEVSLTSTDNEPKKGSSKHDKSSQENAKSGQENIAMANAKGGQENAKSGGKNKGTAQGHAKSGGNAHGGNSHGGNARAEEAKSNGKAENNAENEVSSEVTKQEEQEYMAAESNDGSGKAEQEEEFEVEAHEGKHAKTDNKARTSPAQAVIA